MHVGGLGLGCMTPPTELVVVFDEWVLGFCTREGEGQQCPGYQHLKRQQPLISTARLTHLSLKCLR